jgi:hypothetical protein
MRDAERCLTCHGTGENATEHGPLPCPDCFGDGTALDGGARFEWRLRELERVHRDARGDVASDVLWLVHELRTTREALLRVLSRCQDADASDAFASEVKLLVIAALGLYPPR